LVSQIFISDSIEVLKLSPLVSLPFEFTNLFSISFSLNELFPFASFGNVVALYVSTATFLSAHINLMLISPYLVAKFS
jgi:hypothetical protein